MTNATILRRLCLHPSCLGRGLRGSILERARNVYEGECTKMYGYLLSVDSVHKIIDNCVTSANSDAVFTVELNVTLLKPEIGNTYEGIVCMTTNEFVLIKIGDRLKVLISRPMLVGYKVVKTGEESSARKTVVFQKGETKISNGSTVNVEIIDLKFSGGEFSCVGKIHE